MLQLICCMYFAATTYGLDILKEKDTLLSIATLKVENDLYVEGNHVVDYYAFQC